MYALTLFSIFALGAVIGSFLNVVVLRMGTGIGLFRGSFCFTCRAALKFYELVPVFSFLAIRGRCRSCRAKISFQYPLVETISGALFLGVWLREMGARTLVDLFFFKNFSAETLPHLFIGWTIASVLLAIAVYDIRHKIIPNALVYIFIALAFLSVVAATFPITYHLSSITFFKHLSAGAVFFSLFAIMWLMSRGKWMGFGDAKLAAGIGLFLGFSGGSAAIILSFWSGAVVSLALLFFSRFKKLSPRLKKLTMKSEIPFAPFLIFGTLLAYFFSITFWDIAQIFII